MRIVPNFKSQLIQLEYVIRTEFIPAITGGINCSDTERRLMSLPPRFGGLGIPIFSESAQKEYEFSIILSKDLTTKIINQQPQFATNNNAKKIKSKIKLTKMQHHNEELQKLRSTLSDEQKCLNELNREQGASSWLTAIPLSEEGYDLTKQIFWDLIRIRYDWTLTRLPPNCECGSKFDLYPACFFLQKRGLCFLTMQPHQKHYVDTVKRSLWRCACWIEATTINGWISPTFNRSW